MGMGTVQERGITLCARTARHGKPAVRCRQYHPSSPNSDRTATASRIHAVHLAFFFKNGGKGRARAAGSRNGNKKIPHAQTDMRENHRTHARLSFDFIGR